MRSITRTGIIALSLVALTGLGASTASARHDGDGGWWWGGGGGYGDGDVRFAVSYLNPDLGAATENANIDPNSNCSRPDRYDERQQVSPVGTTTNNVHNDACLLDDDFDKVDDGATYESYGVGNISACPDPDDGGPEFARLGVGPTGKANTQCVQSGYQDKGIAGDDEFHARLNSTKPGQQTVIWCYDENLNGCFDENIQDTIVIQWKR